MDLRLFEEREGPWRQEPLRAVGRHLHLQPMQAWEGLRAAQRAASRDAQRHPGEVEDVGPLGGPRGRHAAERAGGLHGDGRLQRGDGEIHLGRLETLRFGSSEASKSPETTATELPSISEMRRA